jgi:hypothetical protein
MTQRIGRRNVLKMFVERVRSRQLGEKLVSGTIDAGFQGVTDTVRTEVSERATGRLRRQR